MEINSAFTIREVLTYDDGQCSKISVMTVTIYPHQGPLKFSHNLRLMFF